MLKHLPWLLLVPVLAMAADDPVAARLDAVFAPLVQGRSPGLAVLVRQDGRTLFQRGYGVTDLRSATPIDPETNFRLASFTKQFTAMSVMLLVKDGKLRYDDPLTKVFPDFPAYGQAITIRHLLTHTSGLPDYEEVMEAGAQRWTAQDQIRDDEVLKLLKAQTKARFAAGTSWSYSNSGYVVLGLVVAKVSRMPFGEFLQKRIFAPLRMDHTLAYRAGSNNIVHRAYGHSKQQDHFVERDQSSTSATLGDGGIYSNLTDLAKWDEALARNTLLDASAMKEAWTPAKLANGAPTRWPREKNEDNLNPGKPVSYGFGWFLDPYKDQKRMWHTGSTTGFRTVIQRFSQHKLTVILLCNRTDLDAAQLSLKAADAVLAAH
ncbi:serine hydrolase domain-containing protein [Paludibaculum fermentans]|uniref:serine hydrolase domain-containing protein n=1 Tax=Paludibaculum fermentans TaxID=1473598 RepID=UPI003EBD7838